MDIGDAKENEKTTIQTKGCIFDVGYVLHALWVRLFVQISNGLEWLILGSRYYVLFNFRVFLSIIYFVIEIFKK